MARYSHSEILVSKQPQRNWCLDATSMTLVLRCSHNDCCLDVATMRKLFRCSHNDGLGRWLARWRHNEIVVLMEPQKACFLWLHQQSMHQQSMHQQSMQPKRGNLNEVASFWLHRDSNLVVSASRQQSCCGCFEPNPLLWLHRANPLFVASR